MIISFRQGIVRNLEPGFLTVGPTHVNLNVGDDATLITFAHGTVDYLYVEPETVTNAWTIVPSVDQWLYWDINTLTAARTFGVTLYDPIIQFQPAPLSPATDQHWFDLTTNTMKVWTGIRWAEKIRVFACKLAGGSVPISVSILSPTSFTGTQAGLNVTSASGVILFDVATGNALRTTDNKFLTGETKLAATVGTTSELKVETLIVEAEAQQTMTAYTVVEFTDFGKVIPANQFTTLSQVQFGIIETSANIGDVLIITTSGVVTNPNWDWPAVNALLYSDNAGQLTTIVSPGPNSPVAIVIDRDKILLAPALGGSGGGGGSSGPATVSVLGSVKLSIAATSPASPIVVGTNDPRVVNAVDRTGDTMTGFLTLSADPTSSLHAATKQYVDAGLVGATSTYPKTNEDLVILTIGTPVYESSAGKVKRARADNAATTDVIGLTSVSIGVSATGLIQTGNILNATTSQWDAITGGVGGLVEGTKYFLSASVAGQMTNIAPDTAGQYLAQIGIALSSTDLLINIQRLISL